MNEITEMPVSSVRKITREVGLICLIFGMGLGVMLSILIQLVHRG